ncbi:hypothetical protein JTE90_002928 [Oedothorax gibbosus]|uniref:Uncharacterized protein n=1 Tax=Oedothorax gibbosus TaxID=931172 RepID=A0AAV6UW66_9ARAC|nr:hypothetical protein JTE90_002928 [Oedothorax gibbosus]
MKTNSSPIWGCGEPSGQRLGLEIERSRDRVPVSLKTHRVYAEWTLAPMGAHDFPCHCASVGLVEDDPRVTPGGHGGEDTPLEQGEGGS